MPLRSGLFTACLCTWGMLLGTTPASAADAAVLATPPVADSTCLRLTLSFSGSRGIAAVFPDRARCVGRLVLVAGGTVTRSGDGNRVANIPVRILNLGTHRLQVPTRLVLAPAGGAATNLKPHNCDSVRASTGEWVWLVDAPGAVPTGDSTSSRIVSIATEAREYSGQLTFTADANWLSVGGWPLLDRAPSTLDTASRVTMPSGIVLLRRNLMILFEEGVTESAKAAFFAARQIEVLSVTRAGIFFVRIVDPGDTYPEYAAAVQALRSAPGVMAAPPLIYSGLEITLPAESPPDSPASPGSGLR